MKRVGRRGDRELEKFRKNKDTFVESEQKKRRSWSRIGRVEEEVQRRRVLVQNDLHFSHEIARERNPIFLSIDIFVTYFK